MSQRVRAVVFAAAAALVFLPGTALAQVGNIAGIVRDAQGGVLPGVTVEVMSPQLIEKVRATVTDENGRYQIVSLPVGIYTVRFTMDRFATFERSNVELSSDFTAPINAEMKLGTTSEVVTVVGLSVPLVDVQNARQRQVITGDEIQDLPTTRNLNSLVALVPGIAIGAAGLSGNSVPQICGGGMADAGTSFNTSGALSGCSPIFQSFNAHSSMNDPDSLNQGRMQVDGLGIQSFGGGGRSSYIADVGNAQEVTFTLSGSLGESETGGTTINIVPRTGGNRYAGNYFNAYSSGRFFGKNNKTRNSNFLNRLEREYDVNAAYGGPVVRDRLWFYSAARRQERDSLLTTAYRNLNQGVFGANYRRDVNSRVHQDDIYQNVSTRLTVQATRRDKFNIFWDEQYTCENPCHGTSGSPESIEASASFLTRPLHVAQLSWTNPISNRILLDAGLSHYGSHRDETRNIGEPGYPHIPRISESGSTVDFAPGGATTIASGSINNALFWNIDNIQSRASASYITGSHNVKLGYQGQYLARVSTPYFNDMRLQYNYATPSATCVAAAPAPGAVANNAAGGSTWCGLYQGGTVRVFDGLPVTDPVGAAQPQQGRPPVPTSVTQYIPAGSDEAAWFASFYLQDQWTLNRLTLSGAVRYDNAQSKFGKTCVGPDLYTNYPYCLNDPEAGDDGRGVYFQDVTARWGVSWDVFGTGKTAVKYSMGKYLSGASVGGIYTASNPASGGRTVNSYTRMWRDLDGDRIVDCDLSIPAVAPAVGGFTANGECGASNGQTEILNARRFGRSPDALDDLGLAIGLGTMYCGQYERSMSQRIANYCNNYFAAGGTGLLDGWSKRPYEWQYSLGVQHELLPRLSAEVTYNRRDKGNLTVSDLIGSGCDLYPSLEGQAVNPQQCMADLLNFQSDFYDFYGVQAPVDDRLPGGGGYVVPGFATQKVGVTIPASAGVTAVTIAPEGSIIDYWSGIDTNFMLRARGGFRISGGTSTGRRVFNNCGVLVNDPPTGQQLREGRERTCDAVRPFQTNMRGTASYTIPWVDVLISSVFTFRPGVQVNANYTVAQTDLVWGPNSQDRAGTTLVGSTSGIVTQNLLSNDTYGEGIRIVDLKLAKNIRFMGKRVNIGADVYNVFNSDAALAYCATFPNPAQGIEGCGTAAAGTLQEWRNVTNITTPRYARFQVRFDF